MLEDVVFVGIGIALAAFLLYKAFYSKSNPEHEYDQAYDKVLTSEEYKVKGQYDK